MRIDSQALPAIISGELGVFRVRTVSRLAVAILLASLIPACGGHVAPDLPANAPSTLVVTSISTTRIDLTWTDNADNEAGFIIERGDALVGPFSVVGSAPKNATAYSDLGLLPNRTYFYRVAAWNSRGNSAYTNVGSAATKTLAWTSFPVTGGPTVGRGDTTAIFDSFGQQMIIFGGVDDSLNVLNELWALDLKNDPIAPTPPALSAWSAPSNPGAPQLYGHSAVYDTAHRRMVVFGGFDFNYTETNDVYTLDLSGAPPYTWTKLSPTGTPPGPRANHSAVYDSANQRMIVYGGINGANGLGDVYALSLPTAAPFAWSTLTPGGGPLPRYQHSAIADPLNSRMVVFGGHDGDAVLDGSLLSNETWSFSASGPWIPFFFSGTPGFRSGHSAVYDAANQRMLVFGGMTAVPIPSPILTNELWSMRLDSTPAWSILSPTVPPGLTPRYGHGAAYDSAKNRMLIYGGYDPSSTTFNQLWLIKP